MILYGIRRCRHLSCRARYDLLPGSRPYNKTIFTLTDEKNVPRIIEAVEQIIGSLAETGTGIAFSVKVDYIKGLAKEI